MAFGKGLAVEGVIAAVIGVIVLVYVVVALLPDLGTATETLGNDSSMPLHSLFAENGVFILIFVAAILLACLGAIWVKGRK